MTNQLVENKDEPVVERLIGFPYFIEINKSGYKKIKIPCSNEAVAKKILALHPTGFAERIISNNKACPE